MLLSTSGNEGSNREMKLLMWTSKCQTGLLLSFRIQLSIRSRWEAEATKCRQSNQIRHFQYLQFHQEIFSQTKQEIFSQTKEIFSQTQQEIFSQTKEEIHSKNRHILHPHRRVQFRQHPSLLSFQPRTLPILVLEKVLILVTNHIRQKVFYALQLLSRNEVPTLHLFLFSFHVYPEQSLRLIKFKVFAAQKEETNVPLHVQHSTFQQKPETARLKIVLLILEPVIQILELRIQILELRIIMVNQVQSLMIILQD